MLKITNGGGQNSFGYLARFLDFVKSHKFLCIFIAFYCVFLVAFSRYAPNFDDLGWFNDIYLGVAEFFYYGGGNPSVGRFYPFAFLDLLILMKISSSPYLFFGFNALLFVIFCVIYIKILDLSNGKSALNSLILALLSLSSGFVAVFFGICYPEKIQVIWLSLFMLFSLRILQNPTKNNQLFGIIFLNIAIYYKEPTFIVAFAFGVVLLIYAIQNHSKDLRKYALYIIASALLYAFLYVLLTLILWNVRKYYYFNELTLIDFVECALNDSLILFSVGGILLWRIYAVFIKKARIKPFFDGLLVGSFAYFCAFIILRMYAPYYLTPCFVLGIPSVIYFARKFWRNIFIKICVILGLFGFLTQNLPTGIYKMIDLKAQGVQFGRSVDFVAEYLSANQNTKVYFDGIGRGANLYIFESQTYSFYLVKYTITMHGIDIDDAWNILRTNAPYYDKTDNFAVQFDTPKNGDLIIVSNKSAFGNSLKKAQESGELLFKSGFATSPYIAFLPFIKYISVKYFSTEFWGQGTNFFRMPRETYIFKVH